MLSLIGAILGGFFFSLRVAPGGFPKPLSPEEEQACFDAMARGDTAARDRLITHNLRLVSHVIKKYYAGQDSQDDLISIGTLGLIKAVNTFKPEKCTRFSTYAARCVENEIFMYFRSTRKHACEISLDSPVDSERNGSTMDLSEVISGDDEEMLDRVDAKIRSDRVRRLIARELDPRERSIIVERYGLSGHDPMTQAQIAAHHGLSRSYVSRLEKRALEKLRSAMTR